MCRPIFSKQAMNYAQLSQYINVCISMQAETAKHFFFFFSRVKLLGHDILCLERHKPRKYMYQMLCSLGLKITFELIFLLATAQRYCSLRYCSMQTDLLKLPKMQADLLAKIIPVP